MKPTSKKQKWARTLAKERKESGFRSRLERKIAERLQEKGVEYEYETVKIKYARPSRTATYNPDFLLSKYHFIIECKGQFKAQDRQKHLLVKQQYPHLDIRFVFNRPAQKLSKTTKMTYADWCEKHGFLYAKEDVPDAWLREKPTKERKAALKKLLKETKKKE